MYSICVRQHYINPHKYVGFAIIVSIKQDGIDESSTRIKLFKTKKDARVNFEERILSARGERK